MTKTKIRKYAANVESLNKIIVLFATRKSRAMKCIVAIVMRSYGKRRMMTITHTKRLLHMSLVIAVVGTLTQSPLAVYWSLAVMAAIAIGEDIAEGFEHGTK